MGPTGDWYLDIQNVIGSLPTSEHQEDIWGEIPWVISR